MRFIQAAGLAVASDFIASGRNLPSNCLISQRQRYKDNHSSQF
jgi:hypothetical protein